ncbi:hypothetical protein PQX77_000845 [Marasmius sp. AFHP31]|nr:hypothetical protein PQX77_000845 [Marasmius sp. AFHP31]
MSRSASIPSNDSDAVIISSESQPDQFLSSAEPTSKDNQESHPPDELPSLERSRSPVASVEPVGDHNGQATQTAAKNGWGNGGGAWELGWGNPASKWVRQDFEEVERGWLTQRDVQSPRITSLNIKESSWGHDESRFIWRPTHNYTSDRHVTHATRGDLGRILRPTGPERSSVLDDVPTDKWARIQLIKSLREAQDSHIPGPTFTLNQVTSRLNTVQIEVSELRAKMSDNEEKIKKIRARQAKLDAEVRQLDDDVRVIQDTTAELEATVKRWGEVKMDLEDLESIALVYCH